MKIANENKYTINTLTNVFDLLDCFQYGNCELGLSELSTALRLSKNMVFRLLLNLKSRNFVEQNESTKKFRLGFKNNELGQIAISQSMMFDYAQTAVEQLRLATNETSYYSVMGDKAVHNSCVSESNALLRVVIKDKPVSPLHCTAAGKLLIAYRDNSEILALVGTNALHKYTTETISNLFELTTEIARIKSQGYAIENHEYEYGSFAVAAPVRNYKNEVIGAIGIGVPTCRLTDERVENELVPKAIRAALELSKKLGYVRESVITENRIFKHS